MPRESTKTLRAKNEPIFNKNVEKALDGIGPAYGGHLKEKGFGKAHRVLKKFLDSDETQFRVWLEEIIRPEKVDTKDTTTHHAINECVMFLEKYTRDYPGRSLSEANLEERLSDALKRLLDCAPALDFHVWRTVSAQETAMERQRSAYRVLSATLGFTEEITEEQKDAVKKEQSHPRDKANAKDIRRSFCKELLTKYSNVCTVTKCTKRHTACNIIDHFQTLMPTPVDPKRMIAMHLSNEKRSKNRAKASKLGKKSVEQITRIDVLTERMGKVFSSTETAQKREGTHKDDSGKERLDTLESPQLPEPSEESGEFVNLPQLCKDLQAAVLIIDNGMVPAELPVTIGELKDYKPTDLEYIDQEYNGRGSILIHYGLIFARSHAISIPHSAMAGGLGQVLIKGLENGGYSYVRQRGEQTIVCGLLNRFGCGQKLYGKQADGGIALSASSEHYRPPADPIIAIEAAFGNENLFRFLLQASAYLGPTTRVQVLVGAELSYRHHTFCMRLFILAKRHAPKTKEQIFAGRGDTCSATTIPASQADHMLGIKAIGNTEVEDEYLLGPPDYGRLGEWFDIDIIRIIDVTDENYQDEGLRNIEVNLPLPGVNGPIILDLYNFVQDVRREWQNHSDGSNVVP